MPESGLGVYKQSIEGGKWIIVSNITQKFLSLITFFILARLLNPQDYGVIAIVFLISGFFLTVSSFDFEKALMQQASEAEEKACLDTIWTFNFIKSSVLSVVVFFLAPFLASFFNISEQTEIIRWGALFIFLPCLGNSRQYYFFKNIDFKKVFFRDNVGQLFYIFTTFFWIFFVSQSVWALLAGHIARYLASVVMTYVLHPYKQAPGFHFAKLKGLFGYAKWVTGQNILDNILGMIDSLYIGRLLGPYRLGLYSKAKEISFMPVSPLFAIFDKVGFAAYAKLQDKLEKIQDGFIKTFDVVTAITLPVFFLLLAEGGLIIQLALGQKWLGIVEPLKIFAAVAIFSSLVVISRPVFDALGHPKINFKANILQLISSIILIYFGAKYGGVNGVAFAMLFSWIIISVFVIFKARPILKLGWNKFHGSVFSVGISVLAVLSVCAPLYFLNWLVWNSTVFSVTLVFFSGLIYIICLWLTGRLFAHSPWHTFLSIFREIRKNKQDKVIS